MQNEKDNQETRGCGQKKNISKRGSGNSSCESNIGQHTTTLRYIDLFAGVGGFRLGIERAMGISRIEKGEVSSEDEGNITNISKQNGNRWEQHSLCKCVFTSEIDKYAIQTYNKNFGENLEPNDITTQDADSIPDFDLLCGGFPCQSFSIAGKRKGFDDTRGTMFFEIARIIKAKRPKYLLLENVKGLLNHDKGKTFRVIIQTLQELGYDVQWMVLNSKFFGVPQNRERVFIIGSIRGERRPEILPFGFDSTEVNWVCEEQEKVANTINTGIARNQSDGQYIKVMASTDTYISYARKDKTQHSRVYKTDGISPTLAGASKLSGDCTPKIIAMVNQIATKRTFETPKEINEFLRNNRGLLTIKEIAIKLELPKTQVEHYFRTDSSRAVPSPKVWRELKSLLCFRDDYDDDVTTIYEKEVEFEQTRRVYDDSMAPTMNATQPSIHAVLTPDRPHKRQNGRRFKEDGEPSFTLTGQDIHGVSDGVKIRRLTPIECERLQGFPDNWAGGVSDSQRYKQMGNAVTVNVVEAIIHRWFG